MARGSGAGGPWPTARGPESHAGQRPGAAAGSAKPRARSLCPHGNDAQYARRRRQRVVEHDHGVCMRQPRLQYVMRAEVAVHDPLGTPARCSCISRQASGDSGSRPACQKCLSSSNTGSPVTAPSCRARGALAAPPRSRMTTRSIRRSSQRRPAESTVLLRRAGFGVTFTA